MMRADYCRHGMWCWLWPARRLAGPAIAGPVRGGRIGRRAIARRNYAGLWTGRYGVCYGRHGISAGRGMSSPTIVEPGGWPPARSSRRVMLPIGSTVCGTGQSPGTKSGRGVARPCGALRGRPVASFGLVQSIDCTVPGQRMRTLQFSRLELIRAWINGSGRTQRVAAGPQSGGLLEASGLSPTYLAPGRT